MSEMFHEMVTRLRNPGDEGIPDTIYDDLTSAYDTAFQGYTASTSEKDAAIERLNGEVNRLKATNFDLLTKVSTGTEPIRVDDQPDDADDEITIDSLFKRK